MGNTFSNSCKANAHSQYDGPTQKALVFTKYGNPSEVMKVDDVPKATLKSSDDVLVKVFAASINPIDKIRVTGGLKMLRKEKKFPAGIGYDVSGVVEEVGSSVTQFKVGDEVVGRITTPDGGVAEFVNDRADLFALKPASLSHTDAASLPLAGVTALQALNRGGVKSGDKVFISGGAGGVGSLAIQLAKKVMGASVVATTASPGAGTELCTAMGADLVINYRDEDFSEVLSDYDFALDTTGESLKMVRILKRDTGAQVVTIVGKPTVESLESTGMKVGGVVRFFLSSVGKDEIAAAEAKGASWSHLFLRPNGPDLEKLLEYTTMMTEGSPETPQLRAALDGTYPMHEAVQAAERNFSGKGKGKVVVQVVPPPAVH